MEKNSQPGSGDPGPPADDPKPAIHSNSLLGAIDEMELLLSHATQAGIVVPRNRIEALVKAKRAALGGRIDEQMEIIFWHEFQELGQQLQPISVDSLKATSKGLGHPHQPDAAKSARRRSLADKAVRRYQIWSVISLFLLLVTQIYTIFGSKSVNEIQRLDNSINAELLKILDYNSRLADTDNPQEKDHFLKLIRDADTRLNEMYDKQDTSYKLLTFWSPFHFDVLAINQRTENLVRLQIAQIILESISKYLLPLLYGLLGACVYVLRTLSQEIKNLVYTQESDIRFQLRIYLGALAGLAIGWFVTERSAPGVLQSVTPIALAFITGYSVELMFSAMDTIIDAFTRGARVKPKA